MREEKGYGEFRKKMKGYRNPVIIGFAEGELTRVDEETGLKEITVRYRGEEFKFTSFNSLISLDGVTKEDIGKKYIGAFSTDNQTLFILGEELYIYHEPEKDRE